MLTDDTYIKQWCACWTWISSPVIPSVGSPDSSWVLWWLPDGSALPQWLLLKDPPLLRLLGARTLRGTRPHPSSPRRQNLMSEVWTTALWLETNQVLHCTHALWQASVRRFNQNVSMNIILSLVVMKPQWIITGVFQLIVFIFLWCVKVCFPINLCFLNQREWVCECMSEWVSVPSVW